MIHIVIGHLVNICPFTMFGGGLHSVREAGDNAIHLALAGVNCGYSTRQMK